MYNVYTFRSPDGYYVRNAVEVERHTGFLNYWLALRFAWSWKFAKHAGSTYRIAKSGSKQDAELKQHV